MLQHLRLVRLLVPQLALYPPCPCRRGFGALFDKGDEYPFNLLTPWVDAGIIRANPNLFVNTMSYHWTHDCSIEPWRRDARVVHELWGIPKSQINIG